MVLAAAFVSGSHKGGWEERRRDHAVANPAFSESLFFFLRLLFFVRVYEVFSFEFESHSGPPLDHSLVPPFFLQFDQVVLCQLCSRLVSLFVIYFLPSLRRSGGAILNAKFLRYAMKLISRLQNYLQTFHFHPVRSERAHAYQLLENDVEDRARLPVVVLDLPELEWKGRSLLFWPSAFQWRQI